MRTFFISTLGCKVNQYESEQLSTLLRDRGLVPVDRPERADLRVVNTCSVTVQAASKSRQTVRRLVRLPVLRDSSAGRESSESREALVRPSAIATNQRVLVTGCWATSDKAEASGMDGVTAVLGHHDDVAGQLDRLIQLWQDEDRRQTPRTETPTPPDTACEPSRPEPLEDGWMIQAGTPGRQSTAHNKSHDRNRVKRNLETSGRISVDTVQQQRRARDEARRTVGTMSLPLLGARQDANQRAFLKVQDGCDAHCTYCIIPTLRPRVWSKPVEDAVIEARRLVEAGHRELILTGIFLGAYGQPTALRRRLGARRKSPLHGLVEALCTRVEGLRRLRLSSLEPGDLTEELVSLFQSHPQVVPHFHLPLQSGSDHLLRRMNRQYTREDFLRMAERVRRGFDRPAITTDVIVGFPGESEEEFARTLEVVDEVGFLHIHAFPFSPRPGTAAARWKGDFVRGPVVNERIEVLNRRAAEFSFAYRQRFVGEVVEVMVERPPVGAAHARPSEGARARAGHAPPLHGRCERYFSVWFDAGEALTGKCVEVRIDRVTAHRTFGTLVEVLP
jgi:MiaB/RimO family radical SAM methylthiotransferase